MLTSTSTEGYPRNLAVENEEALTVPPLLDSQLIAVQRTTTGVWGVGRIMIICLEKNRRSFAVLTRLGYDGKKRCSGFNPQSKSNQFVERRKLTCT
jgi:hypothetical protein